VPEPSTLLLVGGGAVLGAGRIRRQVRALRSLAGGHCGVLFGQLNGSMSNPS